MALRILVPLSPLVAALSLLACGDDDDVADHEAGAACMAVEDCYPDLDHSELMGTVECLETSGGGYCTHHCSDDSECCAVPGECPSERPQVCAPYTNSAQKRCFLSCEDGDVEGMDPNEFCDRYAWPGAGCTSTGGGSQNRKVCGAKG